MERIYSSIKKDVLLDVICRKEDIDKRREDFGSQEDALQVSFIEFKEGDVIRLGRHKLMCGDSLNWSNVKNLLEDHPAQMLFTDPPYRIRGFIL